MIGKTIGPYEIVAKVGEGGMGEVYRAKDSRLGRDVAIKVLPPSFADDADRRARFEREAQAVAALSHPNVIAIFDTGVHDQQLYVVMELLAGETLRERLSASSNARGAPPLARAPALEDSLSSRGAAGAGVAVSSGLPIRKAVDIAVQIARGLGAAHGKGIVHRDLKPENIFLLDDGQVKILDFGLARQAVADQGAGSGSRRQDPAPTMTAMTSPGTVLGTVGYMAPEQVRGQAVDARADLFAFGAVLYEMVSGQRAYQRDTAADTMTAILTQDPPELVGSRPDLSPSLDRIIRHCLEKNANERFQNARDIAFALEALSGSNVSTSGAQAAVAAGPSPRPRMGLVFATAVAGAILLGAGAGYVARGTSAPTSTGVADVMYKPVTFENGFIFTARFTPDNRTIVYSADWDGQPRGVYVTNLDSRDYRPLGFPGADLLGISRSGELAILSDSAITSGQSYWRMGTLARASLTGSVQRGELERVQFADFGPNNTMAVVRTDGTRRTMEYPVGHVLAELPVSHGLRADARSGFATPRVSSSGEYVAFFDLRVPAALRVKIFDRAGKQVAQSRPFSDWWALAWTPSNEVWIAATEAAGTQTSIFSLDLAGHERKVFRAPGAITLHDISTDGDALVSFDRGTYRVESVEGAGDAGGPGDKDSTPRNRSWRDYGELAAFSRDHTLLISSIGDSGGPSGSVFVWRPKEAQPVRIADGSGMALSPDGSKALVVTLQAPLKVSIVPTGAGQPQAIDVGPVEAMPWAGWLPDGRVVMLVTRPGTGESVIVASAAGQPPAALLPPGLTLSGAGNLISPDGLHIIAVDAAGQFAVCTIATPACKPLPGTRVDDAIAGWSADNQSLLVYQHQSVEVRLDRLDIASGRRTPWKTIRPLMTPISGISNVIVAPDGAVVYAYRRDASQLYVIKGLK